MSVFINNLDDFITPSQACINPFVSSKLLSSNSSAKLTVATDYSAYEFEPTQKPDLIKTKTVNSQKLASISLNDCLACSGCITSAEAILVQEQSFEKLLDYLKDDTNFIIVSISPQTIASISAFLNLGTSSTFLKLSSFLKSLKIKYVVDCSAGADVTLVEIREEFIRRRQSSSQQRQWAKPPSSMPVSSTHVILPDVSMDPVEIPLVPAEEYDASVGLPLLCSSCPGWVCFAEKTQPQLLPYLSRTKSAQQVIGFALKRVIFGQCPPGAFADLSPPDVTGKRLVHVSIQPCFDKKLEASRKDFFYEDINSSEVDLVLSTAELLRLMETLHCNPDAATSSTKPMEEGKGGEMQSADTSAAAMRVFLGAFPPDAPLGGDLVEGLFRSFSSDGLAFLTATGDKSGSGSGGFVEYIFRHIAAREYGVVIPSDQPLVYTQGRNPDVCHVCLYPSLAMTPPPSAPGQDSSDNVPLFTCAKVYGFRNIQSLVMKMKKVKGRMDFDFVEVMACPSGCLNGGGQIKLTGDEGGGLETPSQIAQRVSLVEQAFRAERLVRSPDDSPLVQFLYGKADMPLRDIRTRFHAIPKLEQFAPLAAKW